jgi:ATPase subunit of ABC transporter with duplicated ATPase domains
MRPTQALMFRLQQFLCTWVLLGLVLLASESAAFTVGRPPSFVATPSTTSLFLARKKINAAAAAALEKLDALDDDLLDQPLSKKEQKALAKKKAEEEKAATAGKPGLGKKEQMLAAALNNEATLVDEQPKLSKKELALQRALELEEADSARAADAAANGTPQLSKKELKALKKKEEKMAAKLAKKQAKNEGNNDDEVALSETEEVNGTNGEMNNGQHQPDEATSSPKKQLTLEDKIRKERPPPRIRVMESSQPGYTSLRLENVGITFRNQEVLKDVTWGVQTGDRIGLVGANGAGE